VSFSYIKVFTSWFQSLRASVAAKSRSSAAARAHATSSAATVTATATAMNPAVSLASASLALTSKSLHAPISSTGSERGLPVKTNQLQQTRAFFFQNWIKTTTESSGANFLNALPQAFMSADPKSTK
jgi:hypothetical protein